MGYTSFTIELIEKCFSIRKVTDVVDFGSSQLYLNEKVNGDYASTYFEEKEITYFGIDLNGDNGCVRWNLAYDMRFDFKFDLLIDAGFSEHVVQAESYQITTFSEKTTSVYPSGITSIEKGYFYCWLNKHKFLDKTGLMVNENPLTGNWPKHGYNYINEAFYHELCKVSDYEIIEVGRHPSCGNITDGWNVYSILRKTGNRFPSFEEFNKLPIFRQ